MTHQITAIRKPDRHSTHEHITHVKYDEVIHPVGDVIRLIQNKTDSFYVKVGTLVIGVEVVYPGMGRQPYIRTRPDGTGVDNLLSLPPC